MRVRFSQTHNIVDTAGELLDVLLVVPFQGNKDKRTYTNTNLFLVQRGMIALNDSGGFKLFHALQGGCWR